MSPLGRCKKCNEDRKLIDAHIIPASFYRSIKGRDPRPLKVISIHPEVPHQKSHIGIYDQGLLCEECEPSFGDWDAYGKTVLLTQDLERRIVKEEDGTALGYEIHGIDYNQLKLFFLSVLWRAHCSSHDYFKGVDVGPFESRLKTMVDMADPGQPQEFAVLISEFIFPHAPIMIKPFQTKMDGINFIAVSLGKHEAMIKVDKRPYDGGTCILQSNTPLAVIFREFGASRHEKALIEAIRNRLRKKRLYGKPI